MVGQPPGAGLHVLGARVDHRSGTALGYIAEPTIADDLDAGRLETVLMDNVASSGGLFLYYPSRRQVMPKLRAFIDYIRDHFDPATMRQVVQAGLLAMLIRR